MYCKRGNPFCISAVCGWIRGRPYGITTLCAVRCYLLKRSDYYYRHSISAACCIGCLYRYRFAFGKGFFRHILIIIRAAGADVFYSVNRLACQVIRRRRLNITAAAVYITSAYQRACFCFRLKTFIAALYIINNYNLNIFCRDKA